MNRSEIIKKFLDKGFQLDGDALEFLLESKDRIRKILRAIDEEKPKEFILSKKILEEILQKIPSKFEIIKKDFSFSETVSVEDLVKFFTNRYSFINKILSKRLELVNLISINKITSRTKKFSIISIIRKIENGKIFVEDLTGQLEIILDVDKKFYLTEDEVLGLVCKKKEDRFILENVYFPDIPLKKRIKKTKEDVNCFFISDLHLEEENFEVIEKIEKEMENENNLFFILGDISEDGKIYRKFIKQFPNDRTIVIKGEKDSEKEVKNFKFSKDPCFVKIEDITLFLSHGNFFESYVNLWKISPTQTVLNLLKKRHFNPSFVFNKKIYNKDPFLIDTIPDIICFGHFHQVDSLNYKGTTILSSGNPSNQMIWKVNLRTRENLKID
jgi:DNA polymerase II small subunit/DNA polymerase delta subunit B